jgi:hypothetical protein
LKSEVTGSLTPRKTPSAIVVDAYLLLRFLATDFLYLLLRADQSLYCYGLSTKPVLSRNPGHPRYSILHGRFIAINYFKKDYINKFVYGKGTPSERFMEVGLRPLGL